LTQRDADLELLNELLNKHADELTDVEVEKFASMRFDLTAGLRGERFQQLTDAQRDWATAVRERVAPTYANLVSRGLVPKGTPTTESRALDAMLSGPKLRPPPIPRPSSTAPPRASKRHCGRADEGCYAFVNGDCSCECCTSG
jgi:hypothetical protein